MVIHINLNRERNYYNTLITFSKFRREESIHVHVQKELQIFDHQENDLDRGGREKQDGVSARIQIRSILESSSFKKHFITYNHISI